MFWIVGIEIFVASILQSKNEIKANLFIEQLTTIDHRLLPTAGHCIRCACSMQCAAFLGVSANVQSGNLVCGGKSQMVHWKQGVTPGMMTRQCPVGGKEIIN